MNSTEIPLFMDFEASSLHLENSYPIEVAWSLEDGKIESHLICPDNLGGWTDWDNYAESDIHRITREMLTEEGKPPAWVASRMNEILANKVLLTNGYDYDFDWCHKLFKAAKVPMTFNLGCSNHVFSLKLSSTLEPSLEDVLLDKPVQKESIDKMLGLISQQAWQGLTGRHRAAVDMQQLINMWRIICQK